MATEDDVRKIALSLPEVTEEPWWGQPAYKVKGKGFLRIRAEAEGGLLVFVAEGEKEALLEASPKKFFTTPHYSGSQTVIIHLKAIGVRELREMISESWRQKAPPKVLRAYEGEADG